MPECLVYQCDYWWRGFQCAHLSWLSHCPRHNKPTRHVGTVRALSVLRREDGGGHA